MNGAILIVARNNVHLTKAAVRTALKQSIPCDVLVIDNASSDGTATWLRSKEHVRLHTLCYTQQKSLAACWNIGIKYFNCNDYSEVLVINNDVELRPDTYRVLQACLVGAFDTGIVSAVSVDSPDRMGKSDDRVIADLWNMRRPHPDFSAFMIHRRCADVVGRFDEDYYPAYCEDSSYHVRMHRAGVQAVCVDLPFYHAAAQTVKQAEPGEKERILRGADANRARFKRTYGCLPGSPEYYQLFQ